MIKFHKIALSVVRIALGAIFVWSGLSKLYHPYDFLSSIYNYELVGPSLGLLVGYVLPWLELVMGVCLIAGVLEQGAWGMAVVLSFVFVLVKAFAVGKNLQISCGCSVLEVGPVIGWWDVAVTALLLVICLFGLYCSAKTLSRNLGAANSDASVA